MNNLKSAIQHVQGQIEARVKFLQVLALLNSISATIGIRLVAEEANGKNHAKSMKVKGKKPGAAKSKRKLSAEGREAIASAARKRWAKVRATKKAAKKASKVTKINKPKHTISKAGREAIGEAQRKRWAEKKKAAK